MGAPSGGDGLGDRAIGIWHAAVDWLSDTRGGSPLPLLSSASEREGERERERTAVGLLQPRGKPDSFSVNCLLSHLLIVVYFSVL